MEVFVFCGMVCRMNDAQLFLRPYPDPRIELTQFQIVSYDSECT
jgi:hypothetical protein